jgi:hypothetical protein
VKKLIASSMLLGFIAICGIVTLPKYVEAAQICRNVTRRNSEGILYRVRVCRNVPDPAPSSQSTSSSNSQSTSSSNSQSTSSSNSRN